MCGEQSPGKLRPSRLIGSPPRVRGTAEELKGFDLRNRITPACAGNSFSFSFSLAAFEDHPRVCGEQHIYLL